MDIGSGDDIVSKTYALNHWSGVAPWAAAIVTGTINYDIEITYDPPNRPDVFEWDEQSDATWLNSTNFTNKTATVHSTLETGAFAARVRINTYTDTAELQVYIVQTEET